MDNERVPCFISLFKRVEKASQKKLADEANTLPQKTPHEAGLKNIDREWLFLHDTFMIELSFAVHF